MVCFFERSRGGPARERTMPRRLSRALTMLSALFISAGSAGAQMHGMEGGARIGIMGPDGEMEFLPTPEEMEAQMAARGNNTPDFSAIEAYAQRRIELLGMVSAIVYVDDDAPVGGDGTTWATAHQSLQDALAQDYSDRLVEIRMGQGTYRADRFNGVNTVDPEASFSPRYTDNPTTPTGILRITGGFAGLGAKDPDQRDTDLFRTIITGDLNGDDGPDYTNYEDNTLALFSGFNSELHGLVMENAVQAMLGSGNITIDGCMVQRNAGTESKGFFLPGSGAVSAAGSLIVVKRSTFYKNRSGGFGGAIDSRSSNTVLVSNRFLSNRAQHGGAIFCYRPHSVSSSILQNNYFAGNVVAGENSSVGGAAAQYKRYQLSAGNTVIFNRSEDGPGGGYGSLSEILTLQQYNAFDVLHMNEGHTGSGVHEQLDSLPFAMRPQSANTFPLLHFIRGSFVQDWESSAATDPMSYASVLDTIGQNSGEEVLFVDIAGPDGIIGTLDDNPTPRPDSPNIDRVVDTEQVESALIDFADLNENGIVDEPLPFDLLGNPRSINTPGIGDPSGGIDAGAIEYAGDPARFDYSQPISGRRTDPMDDCEGDEPIRLYVNASGPVAGDGSSWSSPLLELYEALDIARSRCGPVEIWLAAGTYLPDFSLPPSRASFRPTQNVTILGGFAGWEDAADQRDPVANETVLSGDRLSNDDPGDLSTWSDNANRVLVFSGTRAGGTLYGITIRNGSARASNYAGFMFVLETCTYGFGPFSRGAGITVLSGKAWIRNCIITQCSATIAPAVSVSGDGSLHFSSTEIRSNQLMSTCPTGGIGYFVEATGINSMLARGATLALEDMALREFETGTPFNGSLSGNTDFIITNCDLDIWSPTSNSPPVSTARSLTVSNSMLRGFRSTTMHKVQITNCTIASIPGVIALPVVPHPEPTTFEITNSVVLGSLLMANQLNYEPVASYCLLLQCTFPVCEQVVRLAPPLTDYFVDYLGPSGILSLPDGDYRLVPGSPAINTGSNALIDSDFDLDGNPRIIGSVVDRGAYEFTGTCTGDVNGDGVIDLDDLNTVLTRFGQTVPFGDANGDGVVDMDDLSIVLAAFGQTCSD